MRCSIVTINAEGATDRHDRRRCTPGRCAISLGEWRAHERCRGRCRHCRALACARGPGGSRGRVGTPAPCRVVHQSSTSPCPAMGGRSACHRAKARGSGAQRRWDPLLGARHHEGMGGADGMDGVVGGCGARVLPQGTGLHAAQLALLDGWRVSLWTGPKPRSSRACTTHSIIE